MNNGTVKAENMSAKTAKSSTLDKISKGAGDEPAKLKKKSAKANSQGPVQARPNKAKKTKMVHFRISIPRPEFDLLEQMKLRVADLGIPMKKKALVRASILALAALPDTALFRAIHLAQNRKAIAS